jgi:hypothetical protein
MLMGIVAVTLGTAVAVWINDYTPWGGAEFAEAIDEP